MMGRARQERLGGLLAAAGTLLVGPPLADPSASASDPLAARRSEYAKEDARGPALGWNWKGTWLTPIAAPAYTPELGVLLMAGGMLSWRADADSPRSAVPFSIGYGTVGAVVYSSLLKAYFDHDRYRFDFDLWVKDMADHYFGVGYDAGRNTPLGETTTQYHRLWWQMKPI